MLKPKSCPFCGTRRLVGITTRDRARYVACVHRDCRAHGPERPTMGAAVKAWNQRGKPAEPSNKGSGTP